jgi:hypothetical protein
MGERVDVWNQQIVLETYDDGWEFWRLISSLFAFSRQRNDFPKSVLRTCWIAKWFTERVCELLWTFFEILWGNKTSKTLNPKLCWWEICNNFFYKYTFRCCYALEDLHLFLGATSRPFSLESNISWKVCSKHWLWKISRLVFWDHLY